MYIVFTPRLFIPKPTGFTKEYRTYGIRVLGYDKNRYEFYKELPVIEKPTLGDQKFYDFISYHYDMDLSTLPAVHPYVQYVDYMKSLGGGIAETDKRAIEYLKKNCNVLIIPDTAERNIVEQLRGNIVARKFGFFQTEYKNSVIPKRFLAASPMRQLLEQYRIRGGR